MEIPVPVPDLSGSRKPSRKNGSDVRVRIGIVVEKSSSHPSVNRESGVTYALRLQHWQGIRASMESAPLISANSDTQVDSGFADAACSRDVVRGAEGRDEEFKRHAHVQNPKEVSDNGEQQNEQP
jgi:hypothetical protein